MSRVASVGLVLAVFGLIGLGLANLHTLTGGATRAGAPSAARLQAHLTASPTLLPSPAAEAFCAQWYGGLAAIQRLSPPVRTRILQAVTACVNVTPTRAPASFSPDELACLAQFGGLAGFYHLDRLQQGSALNSVRQCVNRRHGITPVVPPLRTPDAAAIAQEQAALAAAPPCGPREVLLTPTPGDRSQLPSCRAGAGYIYDTPNNAPPGRWRNALLHGRERACRSWK